MKHEGGAESRINRAQEHEPRSGHRAPARGGVGNERSPDMKGALEGNPTDGMHGGLHHAVRELHEQHPIEYHDHGPHHGTDHHVRHKPHVVPNTSHHHHRGR